MRSYIQTWFTGTVTIRFSCTPWSLTTLRFIPQLINSITRSTHIPRGSIALSVILLHSLDGPERCKFNNRNMCQELLRANNVWFALSEHILANCNNNNTCDIALFVWISPIHSIGKFKSPHTDCPNIDALGGDKICHISWRKGKPTRTSSDTELHVELK